MRFYNYLNESYMLYRQPAEKIAAELLKKNDTTPPIKKIEVYMSANKDSLTFDQKKNLQKAIELLKGKSHIIKKSDLNFRTFGEAKLHLKKTHNVTVEGDEANIGLISYIANIFDKLKEKNIEIPKKIFISNLKAHNIKAKEEAKRLNKPVKYNYHEIHKYFAKNPGVLAFFDMKDNSLGFSGDDFSIKEIEHNSNYNYERGHHSTPDKNHTIYHELGHFLHFNKLGKDHELVKMLQIPFELKNKISKEVSKYATKNASEFVAEVFTGIQYGKKYSPEIIKLYKELDGPEI